MKIIKYEERKTGTLSEHYKMMMTLEMILRVHENENFICYSTQKWEYKVSDVSVTDTVFLCNQIFFCCIWLCLDLKRIFR